LSKNQSLSANLFSWFFEIKCGCLGFIGFILGFIPGHEIDEVTGTCGGSLSDSVYTTNPVTADCTVIASFKPLPELILKDGFESDTECICHELTYRGSNQSGGRKHGR
jgi:hypothetical protein